PGEIEYLHAVIERLADDEGVILVDLDVTPNAVFGRGGEIPDVDGPRGIGDIDKSGLGAEAHQRVLTAGERIRPAPDVVSGIRFDARFPQVHRGGEIHAAAGEFSRLAVDA